MLDEQIVGISRRQNRPTTEKATVMVEVFHFSNLVEFLRNMLNVSIYY